MGRKRIFGTLVKEDHKLGKNEYIHGRISGILKVLCTKDGVEFGMRELSNVGLILTTECTKSNYYKFMEVIEDLYPGLCEFDYKG